LAALPKNANKLGALEPPWGFVVQKVLISPTQILLLRLKLLRHFNRQQAMQNLTSTERKLQESVATARKATVFIVDDEPMVGEVVSALLTMEGLNTRLFTSPLDALEAFEAAETKPELLITDFQMLPFDGMDLMLRCRQSHPNLRTILYSGNLEFDALQLHEAKVDAVLNKPFLPKELIQKVQALMPRQA
jgi:CheY-like chemotaxis protein